jgi:hypothetical protein
MVAEIIKRLVSQLPGIRGLVSQRDLLKKEVVRWKAGQEFFPGHFHSPIPNQADIQGINRRSGNRDVSAISGIDLDWDAQETLFRELVGFYDELPFSETESRKGAHRYYFENGFYSYADGILFYGLLRHLRPARIIEVGSGFSSCLALDVNELFLGGSVQCTFIEPNPQRLNQNLRRQDVDRVNIVAQNVQTVDLSMFVHLERNDILFIDSSHVAKAGSDVNFLLFEVLPTLKPGVWIHIHDVFFPFEYPEDWLSGGRFWNEAYMIRCLLMNSEAFRIRLWGDALCALRREFVQSLMPLCLRNTGAGIWIQCT